MTPELKAAAERFRCGYSGRLGAQQECDDTRTLALAYVAEHPADDDEPVTAEEMNSLPPGLLDVFNCGSKWVVLHVRPVVAIKTRRQLRQLRALLEGVGG